MAEISIPYGFEIIEHTNWKIKDYDADTCAIIYFNGEEVWRTETKYPQAQSFGGDVIAPATEAAEKHLRERIKRLLE